MRLMTCPRCSRRTDCSLMVMPRSRSRSIESRYWARISRGSTAPHTSSMRSASVDLPWSMWAMMEMLRSCERSVTVRPFLPRPGTHPDHPDRGRGDEARQGRYPPPVPRPPEPKRRTQAMANIKSQIKRNKTNEKARLRNKAVRSEVRTRIKRAEQAAAQGADNVEELAREAVRAIDRAATKGVLHRNAAARRKSRLMRQINEAVRA